jgi:hypothetical protein
MPRLSVPTRLPLTGDPHGLHCSVGFAEGSPGARLPVAPRRGCQWPAFDIEGAAHCQR